MVASVAFQNFKVLRNAALKLQPFNLVIGPNGSGKTSLIEALLRLRTLSQLGAREPTTAVEEKTGLPRISFKFSPPYEGISARMTCVSETVCDALSIAPDDDGLRDSLKGIRAFLFDHTAMATPSERDDSAELASNGNNMGSVLAGLRAGHPEAFNALERELIRIMPEFSGIEFNDLREKAVQLSLRLANGSEMIPANALSQGTLYLLGVLTLSFHPTPPSMVCIEEIDRGIHPRMLREIRDLLYRLSYPEDEAIQRTPVQVIATTHSPYLLDLFRDHPEEVVISQKEGNAAQFECLADRTDLSELLAEGSLGDIWFSGILGGVPEES